MTEIKKCNCNCSGHNAPFRADHVGSYLRPKELVEAREKFSQNLITREELTQVENKAIKELIAKQKEVGLKGITDGEFRRAYWHLDFFWGLNGVEHTQAKIGYQFHDETTKPDSAGLTGKISGENHPFINHFKFVRDEVGKDATPRQTIPAPAQFFRELIRDAENTANTFNVYPDKEELFRDIIKAYKTVIFDLYEAGCRNLQFDDCTWGALSDDNLLGKVANANCQSIEEVRKDLSADFIKLNNGVLEGLPEDLVVNTHVCRGNFHSSWFCQGSYDKVADTLFAKENVNAYYLEFDTDRAGGFEPLAKVTPGKKVVLGLLTSKSATLENKEEVIARIKEAAKYVPLENLYLSTQCGFASTEEGNILTEEDQWKKIKLIQEIVAEVWGE
ncbi:MULTISPECIES: 5-methyltetrahydropteroyltriglutamate--homocysteine S-methyltransferase [unclassified Gemella]|uniref:5-methyltetrahydropteroyltriglutamate-- homocysteine S-methyltransferase n=1 Tax=unclassified Gemella TaxID=2624949 RepID=UPI001C050FE5|nr:MULTISPECIES: 5-methyltetrahydropteroyltriglutamate--homocysteine S-methyltransferase [unclassified Gemella]MBU0278773.1 5-methyltetrahydropteroyltriglutamate--homocysteine S-methyltransferase [Gemella sp. zg-1178]QWQ38712.1 5-methyltetrahydropteroyltriglutamate--homocysteine S-methyltransferase [Gemella sp. zg-570]